MSFKAYTHPQKAALVVYFFMLGLPGQPFILSHAPQTCRVPPLSPEAWAEC